MVFKKGYKYKCKCLVKNIDIWEITSIDKKRKLIEFNNNGNFRKSEVENYILIGMFKQI